MTEGCIDKLFEVEVPNPRYLFGMTNLLSADGVTTALAVARTWPDVKRIAVINPDYAFGRWFQLHFDAAREKLLPSSEIVSEVWAPFPGTTDFTSHITKIIAAKPDLIVTSMWGGMYVSFYKQAVTHGAFRRTWLAGNINFGVVPQAIGKDHPEGALAGVHSNYHFTYAPTAASAANRRFVEAYQKRWGEYPSYAAEAAYTLSRRCPIYRWRGHSSHRPRVPKADRRRERRMITPPMFARLCSMFVAVAGVLAVTAGPAPAAIFTVNSAGDAIDASTGDGNCATVARQCTLRALGGVKTVNIPSGTYQLSLGILATTNASNNLTIVGTGPAGTVIIDGLSLAGVFRFVGGTVTINNVTIQNGWSGTPLLKPSHCRVDHRRQSRVGSELLPHRGQG